MKRSRRLPTAGLDRFDAYCILLLIKWERFLVGLNNHKRKSHKIVKLLLCIKMQSKDF